MKDLSVMKCGQDIDCIINAHKEVFKMMRDSSSPDISEAFASDYTIPGEPEKQDFSSMASQAPTFQTTDGMSYMGMPQDGSMILYADLNGKNKPNTVGEDFFFFTVSGNGVFTDMTSMMLPETPPEDPNKCTLSHLENCKTKSECENLAESHNCDYIYWRDDPWMDAPYCYGARGYVDKYCR